jgi:hypothetical protein
VTRPAVTAALLMVIVVAPIPAAFMAFQMGPELPSERPYNTSVGRVPSCRTILNTVGPWGVEFHDDVGRTAADRTYRTPKTPTRARDCNLYTASGLRCHGSYCKAAGTAATAVKPRPALRTGASDRVGSVRGEWPRVQFRSVPYTVTSHTRYSRTKLLQYTVLEYTLHTTAAGSERCTLVRFTRV